MGGVYPGNHYWLGTVKERIWGAYKSYTEQKREKLRLLSKPQASQDKCRSLNRFFGKNTIWNWLHPCFWCILSFSCALEKTCKISFTSFHFYFWNTTYKSPCTGAEKTPAWCYLMCTCTQESLESWKGWTYGAGNTLPLVRIFCPYACRLLYTRQYGTYGSSGAAALCIRWTIEYKSTFENGATLANQALIVHYKHAPSRYWPALSGH